MDFISNFRFPAASVCSLSAAAAASSSQHETHDMLHDHSHCQETAVTSNNAADFDEMWRHNVMDTDIRLNKCQNAVVLGPHVYLVYE
jgi:hypothetical protein